MNKIRLLSLSSKVDIQPRFAETDQMGVVYHANYYIWFHIARDAWLNNVGVNIQDAELNGYSFPVIESRCRYKYPARYGDNLIVTANLLLEKGQAPSIAKYNFVFEIHQKNTHRLIAEGETINVISTKAGKLVLRTPNCFSILNQQIHQALLQLDKL